MFFAITGTIWLGGSGAVIVGGLYWKRGNTAGAYTALTIGAVLGVAGLILGPVWQRAYDKEFPVNGQYMWLIAMVTASIGYVVVSLLTGNKAFNLEKMLHRDQYAKVCKPMPAEEAPRSKWLQIVGISHEFSKMDNFLAVALVAWNALFFLWFIIFTVINLFFPIGDAAWSSYWHFTLVLYVALSLPTAIWFTIGGIIDIKALYKHLATTARDHTDDGRVTHGSEESVSAALAADAPDDSVVETSVPKPGH